MKDTSSLTFLRERQFLNREIFCRADEISGADTAKRLCSFDALGATSW